MFSSLSLLTRIRKCSINHQYMKDTFGRVHLKDLHPMLGTFTLKLQGFPVHNCLSRVPICTVPMSCSSVSCVTASGGSRGCTCA